MKDQSFAFYVGVFLVACVAVIAFFMLSAWLLTIGYNDLELWQVFGTAKITFSQAFGLALVIATLGQLFRLGPK